MVLYGWSELYEWEDRPCGWQEDPVAPHANLTHLSGSLMCLTFLFTLATPGVAEFRALDVHPPNLLLGMPQGDYAQQEFVFRTLYVSCIDRDKNQQEESNE